MESIRDIHEREMRKKELAREIAKHLREAYERITIASQKEGLSGEQLKEIVKLRSDTFALLTDVQFNAKIY